MFEMLGYRGEFRRPLLRRSQRDLVHPDDIDLFDIAPGPVAQRPRIALQIDQLFRMRHADGGGFRWMRIRTELRRE